METNEQKQFEEKLLQIDRVSRTVAGGRRLRFRALVACGNKQGKVGIGIAKAPDTTSAVEKATRQAKKRLVDVKIVNGTIAHQTVASYGNARIVLRPARKGKFVVAGGVVRAIADLAGIENISAKMLGSSNKINNARATLLGLVRVSK